MKNAKVVFYASVLWILYGTLGCSSTNDPCKNSGTYFGRTFMSKILLTSNVTNIGKDDTLQLQSSIAATEFEVHGRWILFSTDTITSILPTAELYRPRHPFPVSGRDSVTNPLERYSLEDAVTDDYQGQMYYYRVGYAFPSVVFRKNESLINQFKIVYPGKERHESSIGDTNKVSFRMIFQIDFVLIDKDTIWHANNSTYIILSDVGCEKRWYDINKYFTDRRKIVLHIGWNNNGPDQYPDNWGHNYNITKNHY